jgi:hypothetical protein
LSLIELIGLAGELLVVRNLITSMHDFDFECWTGPDGGIHDFEGSNYSIEVKTTIAPNSSTALISGLWQLEEIDSKPLSLLLIELRINPDGITLFDLHNEIIKLNKGPSVDFDLKLALLGVTGNILEQYADFAFSVEQISVYRIDSDFPKLTFHTLNDIDATGRISDVTYRLNLAGLEFSKGKDFPDLKSII